MGWSKFIYWSMQFCELSDECDRLADDLNNIEYCMCLSEGCIKDTQYKVKHPKAYFKKVD